VTFSLDWATVAPCFANRGDGSLHRRIRRGQNTEVINPGFELTFGDLGGSATWGGPALAKLAGDRPAKHGEHLGAGYAPVRTAGNDDQPPTYLGSVGGWSPDDACDDARCTHDSVSYRHRAVGRYSISGHISGDPVTLGRTIGRLG
jgi:hypothetical protein